MQQQGAGALIVGLGLGWGSGINHGFVYGKGTCSSSCREDEVFMQQQAAGAPVFRVRVRVTGSRITLFIQSKGRSPFMVAT
jgi:hypothetical protein